MELDKKMGRILIMDDEHIVSESLSNLLGYFGYESSIAKEGNEAIILLHKGLEEGNPYNAAILDLIIDRGMGGKETVIEIRKLFPDMPVIAISGYSSDPVMANPNDFQFTDSICKPFAAATLIMKLEKYLQQ